MTYRTQCSGRRWRRHLNAITRPQPGPREFYPWPPDRRGWPRGAWDNEPDLIDFVTAAGYPARMRRHGMTGTWCGYVGVPGMHPAWGARMEDDGPADGLEVHGGVTYAGRAWWRPNDRRWWFGFDTAHGFDFMPPMMKHWPREVWREMKYRDAAYVREQLEQLAAQLEILKFTAHKPPEGPPS
jgi:hypothetical protein